MPAGSKVADTERRIELVGQSLDGLTSTRHHIEAVINYGEIENIESLRRFLGSFGWIRAHIPSEVVRFLPALTAQLKKGAVSLADAS